MMAFFIEDRNTRFSDLLKSVGLPPNGSASLTLGTLRDSFCYYQFFSLTQLVLLASFNCFTVNAQNEPNSM